MKKSGRRGNARPASAGRRHGPGDAEHDAALERRVRDLFHGQAPLARQGSKQRLSAAAVPHAQQPSPSKYEIRAKGVPPASASLLKAPGSAAKASQMEEARAFARASSDARRRRSQQVQQASASGSPGSKPSRKKLLADRMQALQQAQAQVEAASRSSSRRTSSASAGDRHHQQRRPASASSSRRRPKQQEVPRGAATPKSCLRSRNSNSVLVVITSKDEHGVGGSDPSGSRHSKPRRSASGRKLVPRASASSGSVHGGLTPTPMQSRSMRSPSMAGAARLRSHARKLSSTQLYNKYLPSRELNTQTLDYQMNAAEAAPAVTQGSTPGNSSSSSSSSISKPGSGYKAKRPPALAAVVDDSSSPGASSSAWNGEAGSDAAQAEFTPPHTPTRTPTRSSRQGASASPAANSPAATAAATTAAASAAAAATTPNATATVTGTGTATTTSSSSSAAVPTRSTLASNTAGGSRRGSRHVTFAAATAADEPAAPTARTVPPHPLEVPQSQNGDSKSDPSLRSLSAYETGRAAARGGEGVQWDFDGDQTSVGRTSRRLQLRHVVEQPEAAPPPEIRKVPDFVPNPGCFASIEAAIVRKWRLHKANLGAARLSRRAAALCNAASLTSSQVSKLRATFFKAQYTQTRGFEDMLDEEGERIRMYSHKHKNSSTVKYRTVMEHLRQPRNEFTDILFTQAIGAATATTSMTATEFCCLAVVLSTFTPTELYEALFSAFDTTQSGSLTEDEYIGMMRVLNVDGGYFPGNTKKALQQFTIHKNKLIDFEVFTSLIASYPLLTYPALQLQGAMQEATLGKRTWTRIREAMKPPPPKPVKRGVGAEFVLSREAEERLKQQRQRAEQGERGGMGDFLRSMGHSVRKFVNTTQHKMQPRKLQRALSSRLQLPGSQRRVQQSRDKYSALMTQVEAELHQLQGEVLEAKADAAAASNLSRGSDSASDSSLDEHVTAAAAAAAGVGVGGGATGVGAGAGAGAGIVGASGVSLAAIEQAVAAGGSMPPAEAQGAPAATTPAEAAAAKRQAQLEKVYGSAKSRWSRLSQRGSAAVPLFVNIGSARPRAAGAPAAAAPIGGTANAGSRRTVQLSRRATSDYSEEGDSNAPVDHFGGGSGSGSSGDGRASVADRIAAAQSKARSAAPPPPTAAIPTGRGSGITSAERALALQMRESVKQGDHHGLAAAVAQQLVQDEAAREKAAKTTVPQSMITTPKRKLPPSSKVRFQV